jgi:NifU-like protein involved in Fe-S cluster formation
MSDSAIRHISSACDRKTPCKLRYDSTMFSESVLDHFRNPRNAGKLANATAEVQATNPVCGDILELAVRVEKGVVAEARFLCRGCTTSIACASFLTERLAGCSVAAARFITAETISEALGGLPPATFHGAQLATDALSILLAKLP